MKKIFALVIAALPLFSLAQEKDIYDTAAEKMCQYLSKHTEVKINSQKDAEAFFSQAFLETCMPMVDRLLVKEGLASFDQQGGELIGRKVGIKLAVMCPKYLEIMRPVINDQLQKDDDTETGTIKGTVIQLLQDGYTYLKLKTSDGAQKRVVWLTAFDGAENFNNDAQKLLNKRVELKWKSGQLYYFKSKSFAIEKIITSLKVI